jgi:hypothetical protein
MLFLLITQQETGLAERDQPAGLCASAPHLFLAVITQRNPTWFVPLSGSPLPRAPTS